MTIKTEDLLTRLDMQLPDVRRRDLIYRGKSPLRFTVDRLDKAMFFNANLARVAVQAVAERLRVDDIEASVRGRDVSARARQLFQDADMPMLLQSVMADALAVGSAYLVIWSDGQSPTITGESAEHVAVERDPITNGVIAAVKRWQIKDSRGVVLTEHIVKYLPDKIVHLEREPGSGRFSFISSVDNPLGIVPVVPLINVDRIGDMAGWSVLDDLEPLLDALNKLLVDMLVTSESVARPKRYATGVNLEDSDDEAGGFIADEAGGFTADPVDIADATNEVDLLDPAEDLSVQAPFKGSDDMWIAEQSEAKFGQLAGADMTGYQTAVDLILQQIMAVASLPAHMVGVTTSNPSTAEALRASEVALASSANSRARVFNRPLEWAIRLIVAIDQGVSPAEVTASIRWADTSTASVAQEADAAVKLHAENIIDTDEAQRRVTTEKGI